MKISDTISVNPGKTALGHVETPSANVFRSQVINSESSSSIDMSKVLVPSAKMGWNDFRKFELPLRTLLATILLATGITLLSGYTSILGSGFAIATICFGGFLVLGLFTRPVMLGAAVYYCIVGALSLRAGSPEMNVFSMMLGCLIFAVLGGGRYSLDSIIRKGIKNHKRKAEIKHKEEMMGYKAFLHARY